MDRRRQRARPDLRELRELSQGRAGLGPGFLIWRFGSCKAGVGSDLEAVPRDSTWRRADQAGRRRHRGRPGMDGRIHPRIRSWMGASTPRVRGRDPAGQLGSHRGSRLALGSAPRARRAAGRTASCPRWPSTRRACRRLCAVRGGGSLILAAGRGRACRVSAHRPGRA